MSQSIQGPNRHWFWGNTKQFSANTLKFVQHCMTNYSDICLAKIGFRNFFLPLNAELADYVLRINNKNYKKSIAYSGVKKFLGEGLLTNEGEKWLSQRRVIQPSFNKKAIENFRQMMQDETILMVKKWQSKGIVSLSESINSLTRNIITRAIFGADVLKDNRLKQLPEILGSFRKFANDNLKNPFKLPLWVPTRENILFNKHYQTFQNLIFDAIESRRKSTIEQYDLLNIFIHLQDDEGNKMNNTQIFEEIATLFIAGQETTSNALQFAFYLLGTNPEKRLKAKQLIKENNDKAMSYINCINKETLRLLPPAWAVSREAIDNDKIGSAPIKAGDTVFIPIYAFHRNQSEWGENANDFVPERFQSTYPKKWYMPFGDGPRFCIGNHFAAMEMDIVVQETLKSMDFEIVSPENLSFTTLMTLAPKEEITIKATE